MTAGRDDFDGDVGREREGAGRRRLDQMVVLSINQGGWL